jgi:hypothetical protein
MTRKNTNLNSGIAAMLVGSPAFGGLHRQFTAAPGSVQAPLP